MVDISLENEMCSKVKQAIMKGNWSKINEYFKSYTQNYFVDEERNIN